MTSLSSNPIFYAFSSICLIILGHQRNIHPYVPFDETKSFCLQAKWRNRLWQIFYYKNYLTKWVLCLVIGMAKWNFLGLGSVRRKKERRKERKIPFTPQNYTEIETLFMSRDRRTTNFTENVRNNNHLSSPSQLIVLGIVLWGAKKFS